ncbi:MAG: acyl-CoA dehydratase activase [Chloroflexota bacterium]
MRYSLGLDIGSVSAKLALTDENQKISHLDIEKITASPHAAVNTLLTRLGEKYSLEQIVSVGTSGSGKGIIPEGMGWTEYSSSLTIASGLLLTHPDARTIIQIGGQSSFVLELLDGLKKPWRLASNPLCAAGSGRFLEQQAYRLGISMEDFARIALKCQETPPRIAARCSVFAKSDLIHLQQKGVSVEVMLYALCESIARMVVSLKKGTFAEPVYFIGGVVANPAIVRAIGEAVSARNGHPVTVGIPQNYRYTQAIGAALLAAGKSASVCLLPDGDANQHYYKMPGLQSMSPENNNHQKYRINESVTGYLGVDVGSTSTKAVIFDESGKQVLAKSYLMTAGRPVEAVKQVMQNLLDYGAGKVNIAGAGVTGSGRYLIGSLIGADLIKNEITAQTRAAAEIDSEADIIEIGGQDSKLVIKRNGIVVDYQMNKACAAGTGSFIDELAEMLGISVRNGDFTSLAFAAPYTIDLGTRCAAFMGQAVASAQQDGVPLEVITASLANAIAKNYLSKVVGNRRLGRKIILTGAVFYNQAVVAAFREQLKDKEITVAEHRDVSGAMGAALLAREEMAGRCPKFIGFQRIIDRKCQLTTFTCQGCDNNCTITRMQMPGDRPTFYGSRCDRYDSATGQTRRETLFDEREKMLLRDYVENAGTGPLVGVPRALMVYDYAPMLIGFLNDLNARVMLSGKTSKEIIERSSEMSYSDSCFPVKLLHGHVFMLQDTDYILYPCAIRLGRKDGEENQKYACPLVQASPYLVRQAFSLGEKLLAPILDFSLSDAETVKNLADVAVKIGFSRKDGERAALAGIHAQERFEKDKTLSGGRLLDELEKGDKLGVVILARSYMSQDGGANLGIADKLAELGVVPVPMDFLPLASVNPGDYSDRPYWSYEGKLIAAAAIAAKNPKLYALALTNFGCGPNSFILRIMEDIMGGKPLGQLEIDEHAAEAGIVTRLEAFVDTIRGYARNNGHHPVRPPGDIYRGTTATLSRKTILLPRMSSHSEVIAAAAVSCGAKVMVLPEPDERNLLYANQVTSGTECLPFRVTLGDFMRFYYENGSDVKNVEALMAGSYGPCRLGKYSIEQIRILKDIGFDLAIRTTVSNNAYRDLNLGPSFECLAWKGIVAMDNLEKLLWRTRPYEKEKGAADRLFADYTGRIAGQIRLRGNLDKILRQASADFRALIDAKLPRRSLVGINGEIYLRANRFSNNDLVKTCEKAGLEVVVSPMEEWIKYTSYRNLEDAIVNRKAGKLLISYIKRLIQEHDGSAIAANFRGMLDEKEPSTEEILARSKIFLSSRCGSEAVLSIGSGVAWMENPRFAGVISVMPHGCMPGGIVAAMAEKFTTTYQKPWISLTYDGFSETNNLTRINEFAELVRFCGKEASPA